MEDQTYTPFNNWRRKNILRRNDRIILNKSSMHCMGQVYIEIQSREWGSIGQLYEESGGSGAQPIQFMRPPLLLWPLHTGWCIYILCDIYIEPIYNMQRACSHAVQCFMCTSWNLYMHGVVLYHHALYNTNNVLQIPQCHYTFIYGCFELLYVWILCVTT